MASLLAGALIAAIVLIVPPLLGGSDTPSPSPSGTDGPRTNQVDLERRISDFTTEQVADARYLPPNRTQRTTVAEGVALYLDGKHQEAEQKLAEVDFGVRILQDTGESGESGGTGGAGESSGAGGTGRRYAEIADKAGENVRGWGRVYISLDAPPAYSVQVPHPVADAFSDLLGVGVLRGTPGGILVIAGTHRAAGEGKTADMAHRRDSVFHAVCAELVGRKLPGIQVHGFADSSSPEHDVVVSTGAGDLARPQAIILANALRDSGFKPCRAWRAKCPLAGRTNKQGVLAADEDVPFIHVEVNRTLRTDPELRRGATEAMTAAVREWTR
ncbi:hypothetical protein AB0O07_16620 [Streptomyces sp. NPDC093085]|uniref:hypothetical protein n=1 Tax=Streptomyces sp. NPDC093085 TaxID=3155068 RepID=UPI0034218373